MSYYLFDDISVVAVPDAYTSPADTTICEGSSLNLRASPAGAAYTWSTGAATQSIEVTEPGTYLVQIELEDGCIVEASANVYSRFCGDQCPALFIPNAFSPNDYGVNDWFHPHNTRYLTEVEWQIFDRWGSVIFRGTQGGSKWDGTFGGQACETGSYFFDIKYIDCKGISGYQKGNITLIR
jgi:gliding motility-associated-like protein